MRRPFASWIVIVVVAGVACERPPAPAPSPPASAERQPVAGGGGGRRPPPQAVREFEGQVRRLAGRTDRGAPALRSLAAALRELPGASERLERVAARAEADADRLEVSGDQDPAATELVRRTLVDAAQAVAEVTPPGTPAATRLWQARMAAWQLDPERPLARQRAPLMQALERLAEALVLVGQSG